MRRSDLCRHTVPVVLVALALAAFPATLPAQDDRAAGLFTPARQLPLVSQSLVVRVAAGEARFELTQVFANPGEAVGQADYRLQLPEGAAVDGFGFWQDGRFLAAELKEKQAAERAHRAAAAAGRATALLEREETIHAFSVYPVAAGELKQVETVLSVPVTTESGRSVLRLPIDTFLGQAPLTSAVVVHLETEEPLAAFGVDGMAVKSLGRGERWTKLAFSSRDARELWWAEEMPPLLARAEAVPLDDGRLGLQVRVALNDAGAWHAPYREVVALVDASFSMRRRPATLAAAVERLLAQAPAPLRLFAVADAVMELDPRDPAAALTALFSGDAGFRASWEALLDDAADAGCADPAVRCLALTDPQIDGLTATRPRELELLFLADADEAAYFADTLGTDARVFLDAGEPAARLDALVDELVRPTLEVVALEQGGAALEPAVARRRRVAEGGMLRLYAQAADAGPITLRLAVAGREVVRTVEPEVLTPESRQGRSVRHGVYREVLAGWMAAWRRHQDPELKRQIVELSLREGIPTAFTALHVADPELSLKSIKPGDPLLTVPAEPGLVEAVAVYPFGDVRRLAYDPERDELSDRFLVPRGWAEHAYRVDVVKRYDDGRVERAGVWYELDDRGPEAEIRFDAAHRALVVDTGEATPMVAAVEIHLDDGRVLPLSPAENRWTVDADELERAFTVELRDRAGNRRAYAADLTEGSLTVTATPAAEAAGPAPVDRPLAAAGHGLAVAGDEAILRVPGLERVFSRRGLGLRSLDVGAVLEHGGAVLVGTRGGDLLRLAGDGEVREARALTARFARHPITGLAPLPSGRALVGVLGMGLWEVDGDAVVPSALKVGSRYVTGVAAAAGEVFVGTAYDGLWRIVGARALKTRFPADLVSAVAATPRGLEVTSGSERWRRRGRDRFERAGDVALPVDDRDVAAVIEDGGTFLLGLFDGGLARLEGNRPAPVHLPLTPPERRVNALARWQGAVWMGTEGGLLRLGGDDEVERLLASPVHGLAASPQGLAVAAADGLWLLDAGGVPERRGGQTPVALAAVAWHGGELWAGGRRGLYRLRGGEIERVGAGAGFDGGWVTALLADGDRLLVGTYDRGVYESGGERFHPLAGLAGQWVPPQALAVVDGALWVGGLGMPPARLLAGGTVERLAVPVRDVNGFAAAPAGGVLLLTSEGLVTVWP